MLIQHSGNDVEIHMGDEDKMKLPEINDMITAEQALDLCKHFKLDYLIKRIESNSDNYKSTYERMVCFCFSRCCANRRSRSTWHVVFMGICS